MMDILLLSDTHYVSGAAPGETVEDRQIGLGVELLGRAINAANREKRPDLIVLLGDMIDQPDSPNARDELTQFRRLLDKTKIPWLAVGGHHDGSVWHDVFPPDGVHEIGDYCFYCITDTYNEKDETRRSGEAMADFKQAASTSDKPLIVIQHPIVHPPIDSEYPYNLQNPEQVHAAYESAGGLLSISGHYHPGIDLQTHRGVNYLTAPSLSESPFPFLRLRLEGGRIEIQRETLKLAADFPLVDSHVHTPLAYCCTHNDLPGALERSRLMGVDKVFLVEHSGQLYADADAYWSGEPFRDPELIRRAKDAGTDRMDQYRRLAGEWRSERIGIGLEIDCDYAGQPILLDEDRNGWDVLLGAVHRLPQDETRSDSPDAIARAFLRLHEKFLTCGIQILAHPLRLFRRSNQPAPKSLYRPLAKMLAETGVAAEINFHVNHPDPRFFETCIEYSVKLALGTDTHALHEAGDLNPHLDFLRRLGPKWKPQNSLITI